MDQRLYDDTISGDSAAFFQLVQGDDEQLLDQVTSESNTYLHLAAMYGHVDLAKEVVRRRPQFVAWRNKSMETPLFVASQKGESEMVRFLMEANPWTAFMHNHRKISPLDVASGEGHLTVVTQLLSVPRLLADEDGAHTHPLLIAAIFGHADIVRELLKARSQCVLTVDGEGRSALHLASWKGHLEVTRELLRVAPDLCLMQDNEGRTPLHLAADSGYVPILAELLLHKLDSAWISTNFGQTILHLSVRNNHLEAVKYLVEKLDIRSIVNKRDNNGETVLHLAAARKLPQMVEYLVSHTPIDVNARNGSLLTALDIVNQDRSLSSVSQKIRSILKGAGGMLYRALPEIIPAFGNDNPSVTSNESPERKNDTNVTYQKTKNDMEIEGLQGARETLGVIAVLIASAAFAAGINPPGGVYQDGSLIGKAVLEKTVAFQIFTLCNCVALFLSLAIVIVLVTIIPVDEKELKWLLKWTHRSMWLAVHSLTLSYVSSMWAIIPGHLRIISTIIVVVIVGSLFVGHVILYNRRKIKKRQGKNRKYVMVGAAQPVESPRGEFLMVGAAQPVESPRGEFLMVGAARPVESPPREFLKVGASPPGRFVMLGAAPRAELLSPVNAPEASF